MGKLKIYLHLLKIPVVFKVKIKDPRLKCCATPSPSFPGRSRVLSQGLPRGPTGSLIPRSVPCRCGQRSSECALSDSRAWLPPPGSAPTLTITEDRSIRTSIHD